MTTELTDSRWSDLFQKALGNGGSELRIISPFIKHDALKRLMDASPGPVSVITRFNLRDFAARVSDTAALRLLLERGAQVRGIKNLHSKLYLFGMRRAVVTSANLTGAGLNRNHEFGLNSTDENVIAACRDYFESLWSRTGAILTLEMLDEWDKKLAQTWLRTTSGDAPRDLGDYGAEIGFPATSLEPRSSALAEAPQYFCKLQGMSSDRSPLNTAVIKEIEATGCHWALAYPTKRRPRSVQDGALMFISRFTRDPADIRVFGRAFGLKHVEVRDEATPEDIANIGWKAERSNYIRVHGAKFVAGSLGNGVSLYELMKEMGAGIFTSTDSNAKEGEGGNENPFLAYQQQPQVRLTPEGASELSFRLQEKFESYGQIPMNELEKLYRPRTIPGLSD